MNDFDTTAACACCGAALSFGSETVFDDRYGHPGSFRLACCASCGAIETVPRLAEKDLPALYTQYYPRRELDPGAVTVPADSPDRWENRLSRWWQGTDNQGQYGAKPGMAVLDYGCGAGQSLLELRAMGADAYGIEADANVARIAAHHQLQIHIGSFYDNPFPGVKFDLIILNQVLEHIPEPAKVLNLLAGRLKSGGRLVVAVPNAGSIYCRLFGKRWINWHIPYHLHHFNRSCLKALGRRTGWRLLSARTITPNLWTVLQLRALMSVAEQGVPNPMWSPSVPAIATRPGLGARVAWRALQVATRFGMPLMGVLNRLIDRVGMGDSLLFVFVRQEVLGANSE